MEQNIPLAIADGLDAVFALPLDDHDKLRRLRQRHRHAGARAEFHPLTTRGSTRHNVSNEA
jgi:hypothetical protein